MADLTELSITDARDGLKRGDFSAVELTRAHLDAVSEAGELNAFVTRTDDQALKMAEASDTRIADGSAGSLEGIPLAIKDLFCTEGTLTTASSHILDGFVPTYESTVTQQLWRDGAVLVGKTGCDEFAMGSSNETSYYGPVINPWKRRSDGRQARARRLVRRVGLGGCRLSRHGGDRHRHRWIDPPARCLHRHGGFEANLWPLLALGHRRVCLIARPGRPFDTDGA